jgi:hypothetical protein
MPIATVHDALLPWLNEKFGNDHKSFAVTSIGKNMIKIQVTSYTSVSVYAFIALRDYANQGLGQVKTGQVFRPASWSAPAKHARGDLFNKSTWATCFDEYGVRYMN